MTTERLAVTKTYKLFIGGAFKRSESGRSQVVEDKRERIVAHVAHGSRKDLRDAVEAARGAQERWAGRTAYTRGQVMYRMAEMLEGSREAFVEAAQDTSSRGGMAAARREVDTAIDRLVCFAGWADKFPQVLGGQNPVDGPYYNITAPEPMGVVAVVPPASPALLGLVSLMAPAVCAGNAVVILASVQHPVPAALFGEICATSDVPPGVVNIITAVHSELAEPLAGHRDVDAVSCANLAPKLTAILRAGTAENVKRVHAVKIASGAWHDPDVLESPWTIEPFVEMKTMWHGVGG